MVNGWGLQPSQASPCLVSANVTGIIHALRHNTSASRTRLRGALGVTMPSGGPKGGKAVHTGVVAHTTVVSTPVNGVTNISIHFSTFDGTISPDPCDRPRQIDPVSTDRVWGCGGGGRHRLAQFCIVPGSARFTPVWTIAANGGHPLLFAAEDGPNRRLMSASTPTLFSMIWHGCFRRSTHSPRIVPPPSFRP